MRTMIMWVTTARRAHTRSSRTMSFISAMQTPYLPLPSLSVTIPLSHRFVRRVHTRNAINFHVHRTKLLQSFNCFRISNAVVECVHDVRRRVLHFYLQFTKFICFLSVFEWRRFFQLFLVRNGNKFQVQHLWLGPRYTGENAVKFNVNHLKRRRPYFGGRAIRHSENSFKSICKLICYVNVCSLLAFSQHSLAGRTKSEKSNHFSVQKMRKKRRNDAPKLEFQFTNFKIYRFFASSVALSAIEFGPRIIHSLPMEKSVFILKKSQTILRCSS